jgi:signal transduction histidine kinase
MNSDNHRNLNMESVLPQLKDIAESVMFAAKGSSLEQVLERIAHVSRELVKARYAALGVPDGRGGLRYFKISGMTPDEVRKVSHLPVGRGLLGVIMKEQQALRLEHMADDGRACGFPAGHPHMDSLLGVPIQVGAQLLGIIYLCDRLDGQPFDQNDQWLIETMAGYAALAIAGAQLSEQQSRLSMLEERTRIGMELHDGVIQSLYAIGMHLDLMRFAGQMRPNDLDEVIEQLNQTIEDIRRYILNLKAVQIGTTYNCLRDMLLRLYIPESLEVEIRAPEEPPPFTASTFESILQIANEAVSNTVRHANATRLVISTQKDQERFQITVWDNGKGFDPEVVRQNDGLGLRNMTQRARLYGGHVHIDSTPGVGTTLTITIPINAY